MLQVKSNVKWLKNLHMKAKKIWQHIQRKPSGILGFSLLPIQPTQMRAVKITLKHDNAFGGQWALKAMILEINSFNSTWQDKIIQIIIPRLFQAVRLRAGNKSFCLYQKSVFSMKIKFIRIFFMYFIIFQLQMIS